MFDRSVADQTIFGHVHERFLSRVRALVYARLGLMAIGLLVLAVPPLRHGLDVALPQAVYWYVGLLALHALSYWLAERRGGRTVLFVSLCIDLLALLYLVVASGGIKSGLMPAQLVFTMLFALLFPRPLAIIPPLLYLPILATVAQVLGTHKMPDDLLMVLWYTALDITVVYAVVYLEGRERAAFSEVIALQRERRQQELMAQRTRIAREIHDGVGAALSGILLQAEFLATQVRRGELTREVQELRDMASEGMDELRCAVSILHEDFQLASVVPDYVQAFGVRQRLQVATEISGSEPVLGAETQLTVFRVLQESLSNVARHARATRVEIALSFGARDVRLVVRDDGAGFDPTRAFPGHYGLRTMSERGVKVGGIVHINSAPGAGTSVELVLPIE